MWVSINGDTPIAGWFKKWKFGTKIMMIWGYSYFRKPHITMGAVNVSLRIRKGHVYVKISDCETLHRH